MFDESAILSLLRHAQADGVFHKAVAGFILPDGVHLIYTDNLENLTTGSNTPLEIKDYSYKGKCAVHRTLDSKGHLSDPKMLMDYTAYKSVLFIPLTVESDGLWIYHSEKNNGTVSWLPHIF